MNNEMLEKIFNAVNDMKESNEKRTASIENRFESMEKRFEKRFDEVENTLKMHTVALSNLSDDVADLKNFKLEVKDHLYKLNEIQEKQQGIIDLLSKRSISHEAEIKRIQ
ncbi:hypothetical protein [Shouchella shacheensis]|uniref:hypothetical protein n=1 Tax=Shouchella shacheensis TaxID=1649580 RepID=UPI00074006CD|nr:hypothetical protein [Shouchella shacheensis]